MLSKIIKGTLLGFLAIGILFLMVLGFQYVWNVTIPAIFNLPTISYLQALGLIAISRVLFGGFGFRWMNHQNHKAKFWQERMKLKMNGMTTEEKEEFKRRVKEKCGDW
jgi:hypothetical protein